MATETQVDVLVIGAGPAGLMCANALARGGINVMIIDKRPVKVAEGQADGIQPRSVEVLQSYGLADRLLKEGAHMHMAAFYNPSPAGGIERTMRGPDVATKAPLFCRYPHEVTLHQGAIENIFLDSMAEHGVHVSRPRIPTAIEISDNEDELKDPNSHPVKITIQRLDAKEGEQDTEIIRAKYCVGTDGAHSWVRKNFGITMDGEQTNFVWGVVDTKPTTNFPDVRNKCLIHASTGTCLFIPREDDKVRLYVQMAEIPLSVGGRIDKSGMGPEKILEVASKAMPPYTISFPKEIDWWTLYIVGQRVASSYSVKNRVYISGDACHSHSPKAGQGMNAGFNDSHNLAWKMVHVLRGWADPSLLDTYEFERRKFAQDLIAFDKKWSRLFSGKPRTEENQDGVSHEEFSGMFETFGNFTSGVGITYTPSALVDTSYQSVASHLLIGQRLPPQIILRTADGRPYEIQDLMPADLRHKVIIFAGDSSSAAQLAVLKEVADHLDSPKGFVKRFTPKESTFNTVFDMIAITKTKKYETNFNDLPERLWNHWSKVFTDDEAYGNGGKLYESYGVSSKGGIAMVRPDGYVGFVAPLSIEGSEAIGQYLGGFMKECIV